MLDPKLSSQTKTSPVEKEEEKLTFKLFRFAEESPLPESFYTPACLLPVASSATTPHCSGRKSGKHIFVYSSATTRTNFAMQNNIYYLGGAVGGSPGTKVVGSSRRCDL